MNNRILFAGTPDISVPLLKELASKFDVVAVLTATDKRQGRSSALVPSPVKQAAIELGIKVLQFDSLKTEARQAVMETGADTLVSFAYGKIFGPMFLSLFTKGTFNVHPSDLPVFRGPSPIQTTILHGLRRSCISVQEIGLKMDEGDIFAKIPFELDGTETDQSLNEKVSILASQTVPQVLENVFSGSVIPAKQEGEASYCTMMDKSMSHIDFSKKAEEVHALVRGIYPWPKAYAMSGDRQVFFCGVWGGFEQIDSEPCANCQVGSVTEVRKDRGIGIACSDKVIWVTSLQLPGKKEMDFKSFINGNQWIKNAVFN